MLCLLETTYQELSNHSPVVWRIVFASETSRRLAVLRFSPQQRRWLPSRIRSYIVMTRSRIHRPRWWCSARKRYGADSGSDSSIFSRFPIESLVRLDKVSVCSTVHGNWRWPGILSETWYLWSWLYADAEQLHEMCTIASMALGSPVLETVF